MKNSVVHNRLVIADYQRQELKIHADENSSAKKFILNCWLLTDKPLDYSRKPKPCIYGLDSGVRHRECIGFAAVWSEWFDKSEQFI